MPPPLPLAAAATSVPPPPHRRLAAAAEAKPDGVELVKMSGFLAQVFQTAATTSDGAGDGADNKAEVTVTEAEGLAAEGVLPGGALDPQLRLALNPIAEALCDRLEWWLAKLDSKYSSILRLTHHLEIVSCNKKQAKAAA
ncbi:MAG: hypothetical protein GY772_10270, partial [bacterium]|nr:hypothetical protein [bacterium]